MLPRQVFYTFQDVLRTSFKVYEGCGAKAVPTLISFASFKLLILIVGN
jgi:hypothetical protein